MKTRVLILFTLLAFLPALAQQEPKGYLLENAFDITLRVSRLIGQKMRLVFDGTHPKLELIVGSKKQVIRLDPDMLTENSHYRSLLVDDFNFDGFLDIAIPELSQDDVNTYNTLFVFDRSSNIFKFMPFPEGANCGGESLDNPQLEPATKTLYTSCRGGPSWYGEGFRFDRGEPYLRLSREMAFLDGFPEDQYLLWKETTFNRNKQAIGIKFLDYETAKPAIRRIPKAKVFLYDKPREETITKNYIVKNDLILILEVTDTDSGQWLRISYDSQKFGRIKRWIRLGT